MFRRTPTQPDPWEQPAPPARATALLVAGVAGTISLVVGGLMWAGTTTSQSRTFDAAGVGGQPAARVGAVEVTEPPATTATLSPIPLPPAPTVPVTAPPPTAASTAVTYVPQTAPSTSTATSTAPTTAPLTTVPTTVTTTLAPTTSVAPTTSSTTTTTTPSTSTTSTTTSSTSTSTTVVSTAPPMLPTLWTLLQEEPSLSRFADLVEQGGVAASLEADATHTLLAPDDDAIAAYAATPEGEAELSNPSSIRAFVLRHLVLDELDAASILAADRIETASGAWLVVDRDAGTVGGATIAIADVDASNGVLHVVDTPVVATG